MEPVEVYVKLDFIMINDLQHVKITYINISNGVVVRTEIVRYEQD